jgi:hypothetical protein
MESAWYSFLGGFELFDILKTPKTFLFLPAKSQAKIIIYLIKMAYFYIILSEF